MPSLRESTAVDLGGYEPVQATGAATSPPSADREPGLNAYLRCPLPPVWQASPDSLRQFYQSGKVPQFRIFTPIALPIVANGGNSTTATFVGQSSGGGGGSGSGTGTGNLVATHTSLNTAVVPPRQRFVGRVTMAKAYQLLSVTCSGSARVQIYGTASAQTGDAARALDAPPPAGTMMNLVTDLALDTVPLSWTFQDRIGANGDTPQTNTVYITVTNLGASAQSFTVTISYVPLVS